jgi:hypothetical protein
MSWSKSAARRDGSRKPRLAARHSSHSRQARVQRWRSRVREDGVDQSGKVSLPYGSRLYKIGLGRAHKGRVIGLLIADQNVRVIDAKGELTLDLSRIYPADQAGSSVSDVLRHVTGMS